MKKQMAFPYESASGFMVCIHIPDSGRDYILTQDEAQLLHEELGETLAQANGYQKKKKNPLGR